MLEEFSDSNFGGDTSDAPEVMLIGSCLFWVARLGSRMSRPWDCGWSGIESGWGKNASVFCAARLSSWRRRLCGEVRVWRWVPLVGDSGARVAVSSSYTKNMNKTN